MSEQWRLVPGAPEYMVSSHGRVASFYNAKPALLKGADHDGYRRVNLKGRGPCYVHCLVAEAFLGPRPARVDTCHHNGRRDDNRLANLYYGTRRENVADARRHGTLMAGEGHYAARFTLAQVVQIRALRAEGWTQQSIADAFGAPRTTIQAIVDGRNWKSDEIRERMGV